MKLSAEPLPKLDDLLLHIVFIKLIEEVILPSVKDYCDELSKYVFPPLLIQYVRGSSDKPLFRMSRFHAGNYNKRVFDGIMFQVRNVRFILKDIRVKREIGFDAPYCGPTYEGL